MSILSSAGLKSMTVSMLAQLTSPEGRRPPSLSDSWSQANMSAPGPPNRVSPPCPPQSESLSVPPYNQSLPMPPPSTSSPPRPKRVSQPSLPPSSLAPLSPIKPSS